MENDTTLKSYSKRRIVKKQSLYYPQKALVENAWSYFHDGYNGLIFFHSLDEAIHYCRHGHSSYVVWEE